MFGSLQGFISALDAEGELLHISEPTSPILDITRYADRESKAPAASPSQWAAQFDPDHAGLGGRALLFENVTGCDFRLIINAFGSYRRMEIALGCAETGGFEAIANRLAELLKPQPPASIGDMLRAAKQFLPLLRVPPKRVRRGKCQDVVKLTERDEVNLMRLPLIKCWPLDGDPQAVGYDITAEQAAPGTAPGTAPGNS
jgi:4-hydroxy-3-polyprenylbenzoate decarboxylase